MILWNITSGTTRIGRQPKLAHKFCLKNLTVFISYIWIFFVWYSKGWPVIQGCVVWYLVNNATVQCTRYQKNTVMFNKSPCTSPIQGRWLYTVSMGRPVIHSPTSSSFTWVDVNEILRGYFSQIFFLGGGWYCYGVNRPSTSLGSQEMLMNYTLCTAYRVTSYTWECVSGTL